MFRTPATVLRDVRTYPQTAIVPGGTGIADSTTMVEVQVAAPAAVFNVEYQYTAQQNPAFFAFQDGGGPWTPVLPIVEAGTYKYRMNMASGLGGVYIVQDGAVGGGGAALAEQVLEPMTRIADGVGGPLGTMPGTTATAADAAGGGGYG
jgi:hypothetical protein